jgi:ABC-type polysaccharide/polyol phosphate transport system ATPase subunit
MPRIEARNLSVEYPIFNAGSMLLRNALIAAGTGGTISRGVKNIVTVKALDGATFTIEEGDRVGLVGHNGAGKSTLLRVLGGIYSPTSGNLRVNGRTAGIFALGAGLDGELTGYENIVRMGMLLGLRKAEALQMLPDVEAFTELGGFLSMPVHTYSAGMQTRLTFGVATAVRPDILLIDEVIGAGDAAFQGKAHARLNNAIESARVLVLASHAQATIDLYCNRIFHLEKGRLVSDVRLAQEPRAQIVERVDRVVAGKTGEAG